MFISPMLLHKTEQPFEEDDFITKLKLDGIRLILSKFDNQIKLYTRHNNEVTTKFSELLKLDIPDRTILDREIIMTDRQGKPDFEAMMERFLSNKSEHAIQVCVFDVIYHNGQKVSHLPLYERKELLNKIVEDTDLICKVRWIYGKSPAYFDLVKQQGLEGIVQKNANSLYQINKRSHDWLKGY